MGVSVGEITADWLYREVLIQRDLAQCTHPCFLFIHAMIFQWTLSDFLVNLLHHVRRHTVIQVVGFSFGNSELHSESPNFGMSDC